MKEMNTDQKETMPLLSIIVPVYNVEKYLPGCLDSILAQTFCNWALILVDDGSPDNSGKICDEYAQKDKRITVIHKENSGVSATRNAGLDAVRGRYVAFVDSDDMIPPYFFQTLFDLMNKNNADLVSCLKQDFSDKTNIKMSNESPEITDLLVLNGHDACLKWYATEHYFNISPWGKIYKTSLFDGWRFPEGKIHEDQALLPKVMYSAEKVVLTRQQLYFYRNQGDSITRKKFKSNRFDDVEAVQGCYDFFQEKGEADLMSAAARTKKIVHAKLIITATVEQQTDEIPEQYKMTVFQALSTLKQYASDDDFSWYLIFKYPFLKYPYAVWHKLLSVFRCTRST